MSKPSQVTCPNCRHEFAFKRTSKLRRAKVTDRFWSKVYCDPNTGCFLWYGAVDGSGRYGEFGMPSDDPYKSNKVMRAHRFSYELHKGPIPDGMVVMHSCDTPRCVNPDHLSLGTQSDNMQDCARKGRKSRVLTVEKVIAIRRMYRDGATVGRIMKEFGIGNGTAIAVVSGRTWSHVKLPEGDDITRDPIQVRGETSGMSKTNSETVRAMRAAHAAGEPINKITERFGMSYAQTQKIVTRKAWAHVP